MTERHIIHVGGSPGSGKSRMARTLVDRLHESTDLQAEHISVGEQVRLLARGAISATFREYVDLHLANPHTANEPLDEEIILDLLNISLGSAADRGSDIVLLDGYPRYDYQVDSYFDLAQAHGYKSPGALIMEVDTSTALSRILKRGRDHQERNISTPQAWDKLVGHRESYPAVLRKLGAFSTWFSLYTIDSSGPKHQTDDRAFEATMRLVGEPLPRTA